MKFWDFPDVFLFPIILSATREATRVYHFINNNHTSFHLWWKENLLGHKKISEYYEHIVDWFKYGELNGDLHFCVWIFGHFLGKFGTKIFNWLFKVKFGTYINSNM